MTALKRPRTPQTHTATGRRTALTAAASTDYAGWPRELVDLPGSTRERRRALLWFDRLSRHRTPAGWQASDAGRIAMLARALTAWERETARLAAGEGGDAAMADRWHAAVGQLSRHLGLSQAVRDPQSLANDAAVRAELVETAPAGDSLLARPRVN